MRKTILLVVVGLGFAGGAWAGFGDPYIGEETIGWQTSNAVTATAGSRMTALPQDDFWGAEFLVNGGTFEASVAPGSKLPFPGAPYMTDGVHHSYAITGNGWRANSYYPTGLPHPSGRPAGAGVYSQNWIAFAFDKPYSVTSFDIWNGSYCGGVGGPGDWSFKDVYVDCKVNGTWQMAVNTIKLTRIPDLFAWFTPNNVEVNLDNVTQIVITPINNWAEDCSWDPPCTGGYLDPQAAVSEVRFYLPPPPPSLTVAREGSNVTISWPVNVVGYDLESSGIVGNGASWGPVSGTVNNSVTIINASGTQFYRLKKQ